MSATRRVILSLAILSSGFAAQAALEHMTRIERPPLRRPLASLPMKLGDWVGRDVPLDPKIEAESQATEFVNRVYDSPSYPGRSLSLWINYSVKGDNLRHSPEICLPSRGFSKLESECRVVEVSGPDGRPMPIYRLGYGKGDMVQGVGFWYYIFGEGRLEDFVRRLPVTNRSSHGRTTRGSSLTVEVFDSGTQGVEDRTLREFAGILLEALESILPTERAEYFVP